MTKVIVPKLLKADAIIVGSPVYFNNVSSQTKAFIDRTWSIRERLKNKIGGTVVVSRKYGIEGAISTICAFFLKHETIAANRGVCGIAFKKQEIVKDKEAIEAAKKFGKRIKELKKL